jgi:hypothetical protein
MWRLRHPGLFTLASVFRRRVGLHVVVAALILVFVAQAAPDENPAPPLPGPWSRAETLIRENGCWTDEAPAGVVPSRAVVQLPGQDVRLVPAAIGFELWLGPDGVAGSGDERAGVLLAFCP